jgi:hypothetical protein
MAHFRERQMLRSSLGPIAALALVAVLTTAPARGADDAGGSVAPAGEPAADTGPAMDSRTNAAIDNRTNDVGPTDGGPTVERNARPAGSAARRDDEGPGPAIKKAAQETGRALDRGTKDFRDGAENFFKDVGRFFSGDK